MVRSDPTSGNFAYVRDTKYWDNSILYMLKISTKFGVAPQSFSENQNSVQNQDHNITLDFNTRPTFHT